MTTLFFGINGQIEYIDPVRLPRKNTSNISRAEALFEFWIKDEIGSYLPTVITCSADFSIFELKQRSKFIK